MTDKASITKLATMTDMELKARAIIHRNNAFMTIVPTNTKQGLEKQHLYSRSEIELAEVYEEVLQWRALENAQKAA